MFDHLRPFNKIVVTGPQRSGTRICARMIAKDLRKTYVSEAKVGISVWPLLEKMVKTRKNFVVQCPGLCRYVHELSGCKDTAIVLMRRSIEDIIQSQERIKWKSEPEEIERYIDASLEDISPPIAKVKYRFWDIYQREKLGDRAFEIEYESLSEHPMWVPKELRKDWTHGQTEIGKPEKFPSRSERPGYRKKMEWEE